MAPDCNFNITGPAGNVFHGVFVTNFITIIGGSRGACPVYTPHGTQFFHFCIHFHQKVPTSEVHAPPNGCMPPLWEILDPPLTIVFLILCLVPFHVQLVTGCDKLYKLYFSMYFTGVFKLPTYTLSLVLSVANVHQCGLHIGLYTLSSRCGLRMGCRIAKGVSERCIARLLLTLVSAFKVHFLSDLAIKCV